MVLRARRAIENRERCNETFLARRGLVFSLLNAALLAPATEREGEP